MRGSLVAPPIVQCFTIGQEKKSSFDYFLFSFNCIFVTQRDMDILAADKTK